LFISTVKGSAVKLQSWRRVRALGCVVLVSVASVASAAEQPKASPAAAPAQQPQQRVQLPVSRVVMFSSGVGYFEHAQALPGPQTVELLFKTEQMNDVLKSLVVMDSANGSAAVTYPSREPLDRALRSFAVDISGNPSLPDLLNQLRGAHVTVKSTEDIVGSILNVEPQTRVVGEPPTQLTEHLLTLVTETGLRTVPLSSVERIAFSDARLQTELNEALALLVNFRDTDRKPVQITFTGQGPRNVRVGYLLEAPIWKSSYRLDLSGKKPLLQGWAIVENTSDADWTGVKLSLVAGRPISFVQDLYTPLYLTRPLVKPELYASLTPRIYEEGVDATVEDRQLLAETAPTGDRGGVGFAGKMRRSAPAPAAAAPMSAMMMDGVAGGAAGESIALSNGARSMASGGDLGELFEFTIAEPVTLGRRRSAMLPILNAEVAAESVSIYNQSQLAKHPLRGVWLENTSGMKLLSGPVTVFDHGSYGGDAQIGNLTQGEKALLSFAVDLAVKVDPSQQSRSEMTTARIARGILFITHVHHHEIKYVIKNGDDEARTLIVEHPFVPDRKLVEPEKFAEKTATVYRFRVPVEKSGSGTFIVREQQPLVETMAILDVHPDALGVYINAKQISEPVKKALADAAKLKRELADMESKQQQLQRQLDEIREGQQRLRANIQTAGKDTALGKRYLQKLADEEDRIEKLQGEIMAMQEAIDAKRAELADFIGKLEAK
jgi:hypothetical protein